MSFYQHNCREVRRIITWKNVLENIWTLFGNIRAFLSYGQENNEQEIIKQIDEMRIFFESKKMKRVSIILKQLHLRSSYCSFNSLDNKNKQFIQKIFWRNQYWDFLISNIIGNLPREMFASENDHRMYLRTFQILHT